MAISVHRHWGLWVVWPFFVRNDRFWIVFVHFCSQTKLTGIGKAGVLRYGTRYGIRAPGNPFFATNHRGRKYDTNARTNTVAKSSNAGLGAS